jgi:quinolinate synthase
MAAFPSLRIEADRLLPQGPFAEAQASFLHPDPAAVRRLDALLTHNQAGVVAHFYMDAELQGVLTAVRHPHVHVTDSLQMADRAVAMCEAGCKAILCAGVDFMSENVRAVLDHAGFAAVPVYRLAADDIGCSLAESAEARAYGAFLHRAATAPRALHVVYINTSLRVKASAYQLVPTISCTSSNVVQTLLQAAAQIPDVTLWYGPDTYMGHNLLNLLQSYAALPDATVRALHPDHDSASVRALLPRFHPFEQGVCIVHHLFGAEVAQRVRRDHPDDLVAAHLEVPGEMFALAVEKQRAGQGVVGSTSHILQFIERHVRDAVQRSGQQTVRVVLGTEAGMVTAIVRAVQMRLRASGRTDVACEIVFPVASEAVAQVPETPLGILPGVAAGEGCSVAGSCATCPYMKKNSLDALFAVLEAMVRDAAVLERLRPKHDATRLDGRTLAELGSVPILHMRAFQRTGRLPDKLVDDVLRLSGGPVSRARLAHWPRLVA